MGLACTSSIDEKTKESTWDGAFVFKNDFRYIEEVTDFMNDMLDSQDKGEIDYDLCFLWDSVGSVPCKMTYEGRGVKWIMLLYCQIK